MDIQRGLMKQWDILPKKQERVGDIMETLEVDMAFMQSPTILYDFEVSLKLKTLTNDTQLLYDVTATSRRVA